MEVILLERVEKLGQMGDVVKVKPGYARNFLLPREKALRATEENRKVFETKRAQLEAENLQQRSEADAVAKKMESLSVSLIRQAGEAGQLYGSVNARDVAEAVSRAGFTVTRSQIVLPHPIKTLGLFDVRVTLHPEVSTVVRVNVARSEDEAKIQLETGKALVGGEEEAEAAPEVAEVLEAAPAQDEGETEATEGEASETTA